MKIEEMNVDLRCSEICKSLRLISKFKSNNFFIIAISRVSTVYLDNGKIIALITIIGISSAEVRNKLWSSQYES